ncbi:MAG: FkbM family methyltransferase [Candidatus Omnitrophica bacterium]|nr:FkbM family methyltransferase [Candidatus Omnitrophota bacterium]
MGESKKPKKIKDMIRGAPFYATARTIFHQLRMGLLSNKSDVSEKGEFTFLNKLVSAEFPKFIVDVGAGDGIVGSNSYNFIKSGWNAIVIEPNPYLFRLLLQRYKHNKRVICVNKACSNKTGCMELFLGKTISTGTLCRDENDWFKENRMDKSIVVQLDTLTNILVDNKYMKDFSILLIDAEGMDYEVLLSLNFTLFQPKIILTEEYLWNKQKHDDKYRLLKDNGYILKEVIGSNAIWVKNYTS